MRKFAIALVMLLSGCVSSGTYNARPDLSPLEAVERLEQHPTGRARDVDNVNIVAMTRGMKRFVDRYIREFKNPNDRVGMLKWVITHAGVLGFQYDHEKNAHSLPSLSVPYRQLSDAIESVRGHGALSRR